MDDRDAIYQANQDALIYWTSGANRHAAGTYLWRRGIDLDALPLNYQVGYARPGWAHLAEHVSNRAALLAAGLIVQTKNGRIIDRFRDRVMFPIRELDGRVAGYLGRSLSSSPDAPKYLNTAANDVFNKSALFYGWHEADRTSGFRPVLVEGPLDALALAATSHRTGNQDVLPIATSGTAMTTQHAAMLTAWCRRHNCEPVIAYDADLAGRGAALRAGELLRHHGLHPHIADLPSGLDPAEHLAGSDDLGPYRIRPAGTAIPLAAAVAEQIIDRWQQRANLEWPETRLQIAQEIGQYLSSYPVGELPQAAGAACTTATTRAAVHPEMLFDVISCCIPARLASTSLSAGPADAATSVLL